MRDAKNILLSPRLLFYMNKRRHVILTMHSANGLGGCKYYGDRFLGALECFSIGTDVGVKMKGER